MKITHVCDEMYTEYDPLAALYARWSEADPAAIPSLDFYRNLCYGTNEMIELGIGNGRIAVEVAKCGTHVVGVDSSLLMLEKCRERAHEAGVTNRIHLVHDDVCHFKATPVSLITFPFRSIGHLLTPKARLKLALNVRKNLTDGGHFIFDHYIFDPDWANEHDGIRRLMCSWKTNDGGQCNISDTYHYDYRTQRIDCLITVEYINNQGNPIKHADYPLQFSWIKIEEIWRLADQAGFSVEALYGDFNHGAFQPSSGEQVWVLRAN